LKELQGRERVTRWQGWAQQGDLPALFAELMALHYDPQYERSQSKHFVQWAQRQVLETNDLTAQGIAALAGQMYAGQE
jgi:tRNA 2-selenouridine synthase